MEEERIEKDEGRTLYVARLHLRLPDLPITELPRAGELPKSPPI